ncbi:Nephrocystin-4 [Geranomyces michiganensis]|nr:Nephrocystin-4 [Geranomyces michiganensis]
MDDDETTCCVRGALELERFVVDPRMAVVLAVEYRVRIPCLCAESESGLFGKKVIVDPGEGVERGFMVGWGWWIPSHEAEQTGVVELSSAPGDNPFMTPMYRSNSDAGLAVSLNFDGRPIDDSPVVVPPVPVFPPPRTEKIPTVDAVTSPIVQSDDELESPPAPPIQSLPISPPKPIRPPAPLTPPPLSKPSATVPISRIHLARIHDAGFRPPPVNDDGSFCKSVDPQFGGTGKVSPISATSKYPGAELEVCFMALSFSDEAIFRNPKRVYFSYSVHAQPYKTSETLYVHTGPVPAKASQAVDDDAWPGILWSLQSDRQPAYGKSPGLIDTYRAAADVLRPYLAAHGASVDMFDGDTHQFLGSCGLTFGAVVDGGLVAEGCVEMLQGTGPARHSIGHLYVRIAHVRRRDIGMSIPNFLEKTGAPRVVWPRKMTVVDPELRTMLQAEASTITSGNELDVETQQKIQRARRMAAAAEWPSAELASDAVIPYTQTRAQLLANLHTTHTVRSRILRAAIRKRLARGITNREPVRLSFGRAQCVPFLITNPYNASATFVISWSDADVRAALPPQGAEAAYLGRCMAEDGLRWNKGDPGAVVEQAEGRVKVFLNPEEECCIPFVVQSFLPGGDGSPEPVARHVDIELSCVKTQAVLSILRLELIPTPFVVVRHDRLYVAEKDIVRHAMRGTVGTSWANAIYDARNPTKLYVRCHDPDVLCEIAADGNTNTQTLTFKHNSRAAMSVYTLYFLLYDDAYHTSLRETWRCVIHSLNRVQIPSVLGQSTSAAVVVRGGACSRAVTCSVNLPNIVTVMRSSPLVLTANSLNEIPLLVRSKDVGTQPAILNLTDVDTNRLHSSYLLQIQTTAPRITKAFMLTVPRQSCQSKRISYTNPYSHAKKFTLHTPTPSLLAFVHDHLELGPGETGYIGLRLLASSGVEGVADVMVMLNDEEGRVEECLGLRIMYE